MGCTPNRIKGSAENSIEDSIEDSADHVEDSEDPAVSSSDSSFTLADVLADIEPALPESLFGDECRRQMRRVAERLPMQFSSIWGFECRLGDPEPFADVGFEIRKEALGPALLAGESPSVLDELCEAYPVWKTFRALARDWRNSDHAWNRDIRNLWLEMDLIGSDAESAMRQPNIFFGLEDETSSERVFGLIEEFMRVFGRPVSQARALREFFDCLPEGARILIGLMLGRTDDDGIKLCVKNTAPEPKRILPWLARLYPGMSAAESASLKNGLEVIFPLCRDVNFAFDLTEGGVGDAFGMECHEKSSDDPAQWRPLLDELTRIGLCLPEKARGAEDYAGVTASPPSRRIVRSVVCLNTYREINHLKVTVSRGSLRQAKVYFTVSRPGLPLHLLGWAKALSGLPGLSSDAGRQAGQA
jgi:hypothetical protein